MVQSKGLFNKGIHCIFALLFWHMQEKKGIRNITITSTPVPNSCNRVGYKFKSAHG